MLDAKFSALVYPYYKAQMLPLLMISAKITLDVANCAFVFDWIAQNFSAKY